jgi:ABC-type branched-subunit amino acid transport system substrate-binding protein
MDLHCWRVILLAAICLLVPSLAPAVTIDDNPDVVSDYTKGQRLMREGDFAQAARVFEQLAGFHSDSKNVDLFIFQRAKAKYYAREYADAQAGFTYFLDRFTGSEFRAHAFFFLGNTLYLKAQLKPALDHWLNAWRLSNDRRLDRLVLASVRESAEQAGQVPVSRGQLSMLSEDRRCELVAALARGLVDAGNPEQAEALARGCESVVDVSDMAGGKQRRKKFWEVAVVLPFTGELADYGNDIYSGAVIATEFFRNEQNKRISLTPYDTKGDPIEAARVVHELSEQAGTDAVIGPLTSEEAAVASAVLSCANLPMLVPAASEAGFTKLAAGVFQMSASVELQGIRMAEYAAFELSADSAAVITPTSPDELRMSRAFVDRFEQLGGEMIAVEYYRPRDRDFGPYVRDVKGIIIGQEPDSTFFINAKGDTLEFDGVPAHVDCLFLPGSASQMRLLLPQIQFYNLQGALLGSDGWGDQVVYKLGDEITRDAVFPSTFLVSPNTAEALRFGAAYDSRYAEQPGRLANLGYDAVTLIGQAIAGGANSRATLIDALSRTQAWAGAAGMITFGENRENLEMPLYRISDGQAMPIEPTSEEMTSQHSPEAVSSPEPLLSP